MLQKIHEKYVDEALFLMVTHDVNPRAMSPKVKGFVQAQNWFQDFSPITMDEVDAAGRGSPSRAADRLRRCGDRRCSLYIAEALLYVTPVALGVSIVCFLLVHLAPGDPLTAVLPIDATAEQQARDAGRLRLRQAAAGPIRHLALAACCRAISAPPSPPAGRCVSEVGRARSTTR